MIDIQRSNRRYLEFNDSVAFRYNAGEQKDCALSARLVIVS